MFSASMSGMTSRKLIDDEYRGEWMGDYLIGEYQLYLKYVEAWRDFNV